MNKAPITIVLNPSKEMLKYLMLINRVSEGNNFHHRKDKESDHYLLKIKMTLRKVRELSRRL